MGDKVVNKVMVMDPITINTYEMSKSRYLKIMNPKQTELYLLYEAIRNNNYQMVRLIHQSGADINWNECNFNNRKFISRFGTPLMISCREKNYNLAKYFLSNGALFNIGILAKWQNWLYPEFAQMPQITAIHVCVEFIRDSETFQHFFRLFLNHNLNLDDPFYKCDNLLVYSLLIEKNHNAAKILIRNGANVNTLLNPHMHQLLLGGTVRHGKNLCVKEQCLKENEDFKKELNTELSYDMLELVIYAGVNINKLASEICLNLNDERYELIYKVTKNPLKLRDLCRIKIRNTLGRDPLNKIQKLELPLVLKKFLSFEIL